MSIKDTLIAITHTGADVSDLDDRNRIIKVNKLAITTCLLAFMFGVIFYSISGKAPIFIGTCIESAACIFVIYLNKKRKYDMAALSVQLTHNLATLFFGVILSAVVEASLLAIFLIGTSVLILKGKKYRIACITLTIVTLILLEINRFYGIIAPYSFNYTSQVVIHYSAILVILSLNIMIIMFYVKHNDTLLNTLKEHTNNLEKQVRIRTADLEKANDYKSVFVRETNHEIRVPLNAIYSISQLMLIEAERKNEPDAVKPAEHLCAASHHALDIINNVLELSRIEAGKLHEVHLAPFAIKKWIDNIVFTSQYTAKTKGVKIILDYNKLQMPEQIVSDKLKLTQIVNNLLFNAIKFTDNDSNIVLSVTVEDDSCYIKVRDQGQGISEERLASIFDPFITSRNNFSGGTGLGLHIAHHLLTLLGGDISVNSVVGKGTEFSIRFPLVIFNGEEDTSVVLADALENINYIGMKMLVIEDDYMSLVHLKRYLTHLGSEPMTAATGAAAIEILKDNIPDVIIMDRHLPDMDATALITMIGNMPAIRDVPIIITTGDVFETPKEDGFKGVAAYVIKPIDFKLLNIALSKCLVSPALLK